MHRLEDELEPRYHRHLPTAHSGSCLCDPAKKQSFLEEETDFLWPFSCEMNTSIRASICQMARVTWSSGNSEPLLPQVLPGDRINDAVQVAPVFGGRTSHHHNCRHTYLSLSEPMHFHGIGFGTNWGSLSPSHPSDSTQGEDKEMGWQKQQAKKLLPHLGWLPPIWAL